MVNNLYEETMTVAAELRAARLKVVQVSTELNGLAYKLGVAAARIERGLIKKVGDEKKLGPSLDSRERIFVLARDADQEYLALWQSRETVNERLETMKVEVNYLQDKMTVMLTAAKTYGE